MFVTWRLAGTLPQVPAEVLRRDPRPGRFFLAQDRLLDSAPQGPRWLQDPRIGTVVAEALAYGERVRRAYSLFAWVILPNHVHLVLRPQEPVVKVPFNARTQAEPPAPQGESTTCASVGQAVSPATDFHHRLPASWGRPGKHSGRGSTSITGFDPRRSWRRW